MEAVCYGERDFYRIKNGVFFSPLAHEYRKFVENIIYRSTEFLGEWSMSAGDELAVFTRWHKNSHNY
jgi:hypothetical protein